jgi:hypothetical protein
MLDLYGHLFPGNEAEASALLDQYLDRASWRHLSPDLSEKRSAKWPMPAMMHTRRALVAPFLSGFVCGLSRYCASQKRR